MPILSLDAASVVHRCIACGSSRVLDLDQLEVGVFDDQQGACISLPTCPQPSCRTFEVLVGATEDAPEHPMPGSYGHLHRLLVDHLHTELVDADKLSEDARGKPLRLRRRTQEQLAKWFPDGLAIIEEPAAVKGAAAS